MGSVNFDFNFWTLSLLLLNFALAAFVAFTNRHKAAADELKAVKSSLHSDIQRVGEQVNKQAEKLSAVESDIKNAISSEDLSVVHRRMDKVLETVGPLAGRLDEMSKTMMLMNQNLMQLIQQRSK